MPVYLHISGLSMLLWFTSSALLFCFFFDRFYLNEVHTVERHM